MDFAGPLFITVSKDQASPMMKAYIALYTCASSRAVHLELVTSLTAESFLRCFQRFIRRRGIPRLMVSDNAKTIKSASGTLETLFNLPSVQAYFSEHKIRWRFNLEKAPWWDGFFERLVKSTKRCLRKLLRNAKLNYEELFTVMTEVEAVLNSRPLTYMYSEDIETLLTPSHLVMGKRLLTLLDTAVKESNEVDLGSDLTRRAKYLQILFIHFWNRFRRECLLSLRENYKRCIKVLKRPQDNP